jgi:hypothetical protein
VLLDLLDRSESRVRVPLKVAGTALPCRITRQPTQTRHAAKCYSVTSLARSGDDSRVINARKEVF